MLKFISSLLQSLAGTLVLLLLLEGACVLAGVPQGAARYIEGIVLHEDLKVEKPANEIRIFAYGESTIHGSHYFPYSNPVKWLEAYMHDFLPGKKIRFVNFGRMGQGSHFIYKSFRDTAVYKPDIVLFYFGHNAFLPGNRKDQIEAKESTVKFFWREVLRKSRFFSMVYRWQIEWKAKREQGGKDQDSIEYAVIETPPSGIGAENSIPNNTPAYRDNILFFKNNLLQIIDLAKRRGIHALFCEPVGNLKDFAPFMSAHMKTFSPAELSRWEELYQKGDQAMSEGKMDEALEFYARAHGLDPSYAELSFKLAEIHFKKGHLAVAERLFKESRDNDTIKVRAPRDIVEIYQDLAKAHRLELMDTEKVLVSEAPGGILGEPVIEDNVHFSIKGHSLLGREMARVIAEKGWIAPAAEWQWNRERSFEEIFNELGITEDLLFSADLKMVHYFGSRYQNRLRFAKKAIEIHPDDPHALRHLAWTYWLMGKKELAVEVYEKIGKIDAAGLEEIFGLHPDIKDFYDNKDLVIDVSSLKPLQLHDTPALPGPVEKIRKEAKPAQSLS